MSNKKAIGKRSKTRHKGQRKRSRTTVNKKLRKFRKGSRVTLIIDTSIHAGMPSLRYQGMTGTVLSKRGAVYMVEVKEGNLVKFLVVSPAHLCPVKEGAKQNAEAKVVTDRAAELKEFGITSGGIKA
ncbi:MAG: 50S ribosomal protein L21e [Candidatus Diapherotrites archaeon]|nr:50S ribosomal protein L21e [Candidatus Micrarchaeota archaeon]MBU1940106.1 50S ribosomal protein L21e [Candidatus Micrarchaeota archaeon]